MARTTVEIVKNVLDTTLTDTQITSYVNQANRMVTATLGGEGLTTSVLKDIETWLTAHLIAITRERQPSEEKVGDVLIRYQGKFGDFLNSTTYGQMVLMLDTSGKMQRQTKKRASIRAIQQDVDAASELTTDEW